ncbi:hypothetical protein [Pseudarthrobacter sp. NIBRBAC000502770]|uniref:hypothetical protein n=1 Tax=Pseudarthrobacter sp. NIBRBAC000502770 TaxID=2590785 RepID=UPI00143CE6A3|nr:hypothetical protein [Pseudarthrobacter sp. NIBRBAC000502770]
MDLISGSFGPELGPYRVRRRRPRFAAAVVVPFCLRWTARALRIPGLWLVGSGRGWRVPKSSE